MNKSIHIAITCIGSGVAQSVLSSCRISKLPLRTFGFGNNPMAYGSFESDVRDFVPGIYEENYTEKLLEKCREHQIDILIPTLDYEVFVVSEAKEKFLQEGVNVLVSGHEITSLCNDKLKLSSAFGKLNSLFCRSYSIEKAAEALDKGEVSLPLIAKPNSGFASKGVSIINHREQLRQLKEASIVQEMALPMSDDSNYKTILEQIKKGENPQLSEISFQIVSGPDGKIAGKMVSWNKLQNGIPIEIIPFQDAALWEKVDLLHNELLRRGHLGPLNLQGRITKEGLKIFEMNARFTGLTYMRAMMGFNEVEACIKAFGKLPFPASSLQLNSKRFGIRQTADKVIHPVKDEKVNQLQIKLNKVDSIVKRNILVTGAGGYLGRNLIRNIATSDHYEIHALSSDKDKINRYFRDLKVTCHSLEDYKNGSFSLGSMDTLIHCAFARPHYPDSKIASALNFSQELFMDVIRHEIPEIINISSQSIYGNSTENKKETDIVAPSSSYGQAKHAAELMMKTIKSLSPHSDCTSLRFSSLSGGLPGYIDSDLLSKFMSKVIQGESILLRGRNITIERLDIRDAISAIVSLLRTDSSNWKEIYNIGPDRVYNGMELAEIINRIVSKQFGIPKVAVELKEENVLFKQGLNSALFREDTGWKSEFNMDDTILSLIDHYKQTH